jgi:hypothetical protein
MDFASSNRLPHSVRVYRAAGKVWGLCFYNQLAGWLQSPLVGIAVRKLIGRDCTRLCEWDFIPLPRNPQVLVPAKINMPSCLALRPWGCNISTFPNLSVEPSEMCRRNHPRSERHQAINHQGFAMARTSIPYPPQNLSNKNRKEEV